MNWHNVLMRPSNLYEELLRRKLISGGGSVLKTVTGVSPLTLLNVASRGIKSLTQFGKCEQASTPSRSNPVDIYCNNGKLVYSNGAVVADGTPETLMVSAVGAETQTVNDVSNLFAVGNIADEQDIISGTVKRRCEAFLYDGTQTVLDPYLSTTGGKDNGAIIVHPKGAEYSGSIVSLDFDPEDEELGALSVSVNPAQDLHGYDSPWPAGGGKNLLWLNNGIFKTGAFTNTTPRELTGVGTWVGISAGNYMQPSNITSYTIGDNSLTVKATANGFGVGIECKLTAGQQYTLSWVGTNASVGISFYDGDGAPLSYVTSSVTPKTVTVPESTANAIIVLRGNAANVTGEFSNVQLEEGPTATAYSPYSNICPISGWTGANVTRTGKNLLNSNSITKNKIIDDTGAIVTNNFIEITDYIRVKPSTQYVLSGTLLNGSSSNADVRVNFYTADKTWKYRSGANKTNGLIFTTDADTYFVRFSFSKDSTDQMCEEGSTATPFVAYNGDTYSITFPAAAGTVYGGTLDVTTGVLTVTHGNIASYSGETLPGRWISSMDVYSVGSTPTTGAQVVYELATPLEISLTPEEITLLEGENNLWSDAGDMKALVLSPTTEQVAGQHLTARDTATITAQTNNISDITLEVKYWENAE